MQHSIAHYPGDPGSPISQRKSDMGISGRSSRLSVVIATHDRAADAMRCLDALLAQMEGETSEVVVVDSASTPAERRLLEIGLARYPTVRHIRIDETGLSMARNAGIAATTSEWVAFLDDDAVPNPDWHARLQEVLARVPDDCCAIGGRILPLFPSGEAPQLGPRWKMYVSINDADDEWDCTERFNFIGANCVFRRSALDQVGGFPLTLGRFGQQLLSGDDVMLLHCMRDQGWRIRYHSQFGVRHKVSRERLTRRWVRSRAYWEGITTVRMAKLRRDRSWIRLSVKALIGAPIVGVFALLPSDGEWDFRFCFNCGVVLEAIGMTSPVAK